MQVLRINTQGGFQGLEMFVVLAQRILEPVGALIEFLRPVRLLFRAEYPATHVLRFQHEDAIGRNKHMVDLRGAVGCIQRDVVQTTVDLVIELPVGKQAHP